MDGRTTDTFIYYKLTYEPSAQVSYKSLSHIIPNVKKKTKKKTELKSGKYQMFLSKQLYGIPGKTCRQLFSAHTSTFYIPGIYWHLKALSMHVVSFFLLS